RSNVPVSWLATRYPSVGGEVKVATDLPARQTTTKGSSQVVPANTPLSQPYWLREDHPEGLFRVKDARLIGQPENPPVFPVEHVFEVGGQTLVIPDEPVQLMGGKGTQVRRRLEVIPPVALKFSTEVELFAPGSMHAVEIGVIANRAKTEGTL